MAQLLIMVPATELEPHVARLRAQHDPSAKRGLGAHVTLLHSNLVAPALEPVWLERLAAGASSSPTFDYQVTRVGRFPGTLFLAAEPVAPFLRLQKVLATALQPDERGPQVPLVPHISVVRKSSSDDRGIEAELEAILAHHAPIRCVCTRIALLENSSGRWRPVREFALRGPAR